MHIKRYYNIPSTSKTITFLMQAQPIRFIPKFIELLVGTILTQADYVTEAWLAIKPLQTWSFKLEMAPAG